MRRWLAILLLGLASVYLGATGVDHCAEGLQDDCAPICHILCADGCGAVPVPDPPVQPSSDPLPTPRFALAPVESLLSLQAEPEKDPPRA